MVATVKTLLKNLHSESLPPQSLKVFALINIMKVNYFANKKSVSPDLRPKDATYYLDRIQNGKHEKIIKDLRSEIDPEKKVLIKGSLSAVTFCGTFTTRKKDALKQGSGLAILDFDKALNYKSDFTKSYHLRGLAKYNLKDYNGAIEDFDSAIELDNSDEIIHFKPTIRKMDDIVYISMLALNKEKLEILLYDQDHNLLFN